MPRYLFHVYNSDVTIDREGRELADFDSAKTEALRAVRELICDAVRHGELVVLSHRVEVEDEAGQPLLVVRYADAFTLKE